MLFFRRKLRAPPGGKWFYVIPETKLYIETRTTWAELVRMAKANYAANQLSVPEDLEARMMDYFCRQVHESYCEGDDEGRARAKKLTFFDVVKFTEILLNKAKAKLTGKDFYVSLSEAERRAEICIRCPKHFMEWCTACDGLKSTFAPWVANRSTRLDGSLRVCAVCGCVLTAKVHVKKEYLADDEKSIAAYPENCWVKNEQPR